MRNFDHGDLALVGNSPLRHAGAHSITLGRARTPIFLSLALNLLSVGLLAQTPAVDSPLRYNGQPVRVPFPCVEEELQAAGLLCTEEEPCAIFLELSGVASAGKKLFVAGNLHATTGTLASILLASDDGGATWREPVPRVKGAAFEQVDFYDLEHGWAAGEGQVPLPRDPFFLVTSDGGQSWRTRPVTEEGGSGSMQRFWFDSARHGELVVDAGKSSPGGRYLDYESETGGESWMIRSIGDRMPALKHAPPPGDSDLRLRANAAGTAWLVERRNGEKWETSAAFLIEAASCRIKPVEPNEPAAEPEAAGKAMADAADPGDKDYVEEIKLGDPNAKPTAAKPAKGKPAKKVQKP
jgi:hypothetical protein